MNKIIKRLVLGVLMLTMVFDFSIISFATEDVSVVQRAHTYHSWITVSSYEVKGSGVNPTNTTCLRRVITTRLCTECQESYMLDENIRKNHDGPIRSATCNGRRQTHKYECWYCETFYYKSVACPNAVHSGTCVCLPI